jgi:hypothetical protein
VAQDPATGLTANVAAVFSQVNRNAIRPAPNPF